MFNIDKSINKLIGKSGTSRKSISTRTAPLKPFAFGGLPPPSHFFKPKKAVNHVSNVVTNIRNNKQKVLNNFIKPFGGKNDWDGDGVPNWKDCQPRNPMRQDWLGKTTVPIADHPKSFGYVGWKKQLTPDEYMEWARKSHKYTGTPEQYEKENVTGYRYGPGPHIKTKEDLKNYEKYKESKTKRMNWIKEGILSKDKVVPEPYIELREGLPIEQEGRHRAVSAKDANLKIIPVTFIESRPTKEQLEQSNKEGWIEETYENQQLGTEVLTDKDSDGMIAAADRDDNNSKI